MYDAIMKALDDDEVLVFPDAFVNNIHMYDQVTDVAYLVKDENDTENAGRVNFVWRRDLKKWAEGRNPDFLYIVTKLIIARVKLPWNELETEWIVSEGELENYNRDEVEILDVYIRARFKGDPEGSEKMLMSPWERRAFEAHPDDYVVTERKYVIAWKVSPETRERFLEI